MPQRFRFPPPGPLDAFKTDLGPHIPSFLRPLNIYELAGLAMDRTGRGLVSSYPFMLVAANDAPDRVKSFADYVCDGVADDVEINAAINALPGPVTSSGRAGQVILSSGKFNTAAPIIQPDVGGDGSGIDLTGAGMHATVIQPDTDLNAPVIQMNGHRGSLHDLTVRGRGANDTNANDGIQVLDWQCLVQDVWVEGCKGHGIVAQGANESTILRCIVKSNFQSGIYAASLSDSQIIGCTLRQNGVIAKSGAYPANFPTGAGAIPTHWAGLSLGGSNRVIGNHMWGNDVGLICNGANVGTVTGNVIADNGMASVSIESDTNATFGMLFGDNTYYTVDTLNRNSAAIVIIGAAAHTDNIFQGGIFSDGIAVSAGSPIWKYIVMINSLATGQARNQFRNFTIRTAATSAQMTPFLVGAGSISRSGISVRYDTDGTPSTALTENSGTSGNVADGGTIAHGLMETPTAVSVTPTIASEFVSVTAVDATNITVAIKKDTGLAGTAQPLYWSAKV